MKKISNPYIGFISSILSGIIANILSRTISFLSLSILFIMISIFLWIFFFYKLMTTHKKDTKGSWAQFIFIFLAFVPLIIFAFTILFNNISINNFLNKVAHPTYQKFPSNPNILQTSNNIKVNIVDKSTEIILSTTGASGIMFCKFNTSFSYKDLQEISIVLNNVNEFKGSMKIEGGAITFKPKNPLDRNPNLPEEYFLLRNGKIPLVLPHKKVKNNRLPSLTFTFDELEYSEKISIKILKKPAIFRDSKPFLIFQIFLVVMVSFLIGISFYKYIKIKNNHRGKIKGGNHANLQKV